MINNNNLKIILIIIIIINNNNLNVNKLWIKYLVIVIYAEIQIMIIIQKKLSNIFKIIKYLKIDY